MKKILIALGITTAAFCTSAQAQVIQMVCMGKTPTLVTVDSEALTVKMNNTKFYFTTSDKNRDITMNQFESLDHQVVQIVSSDSLIGFSHFVAGKLYQQGICNAQ